MSLTGSTRHGSRTDRLHLTVKNPHIHIKGQHSYYSDAWSGSFEQSVVRYHDGDDYSLQHWQLLWEVDTLCIGDDVCTGAEAVMDGNHTHRATGSASTRLPTTSRPRRCPRARPPPATASGLAYAP